MYRYVVAFLLVLAIVPFTARPAAAADFRSSDTISIGSGETIDDDVYLVGNTVRISGTVRGDAFIAAQTIVIDGVIEGGLSAAGSDITITGRIGRGARIAGQNITIGGQIGRDLLAAGNNVTVLKEGRIGGDMVGGSTTLALDGGIGRDLLAGGSAITINGTVGRNVRLGDVTSVRVGEAARITGSLTYTSERDATIMPGSQIGQNPGRTAPDVREARSPIASFGNILFDLVKTFLGMAVLGLLWLWLGRRSADAVTSALVANLPLSFAIGLAASIVVPIFALIAFGISILLGTWSVPIVMLAGLAIGSTIASSVVALVIGSWLLQRFAPSSPRWVTLLAGAAIVSVLGAIPILGFFVSLAILLFGLGAAVIALFQASRPTKALAVA